MKHALTLFLAVGLAQCVHADVFTTSDLFNPGDQLLVTDATTGEQWLKPIYIAEQRDDIFGHDYNDYLVQNLIAGYGFRYATAAEVNDLITNNFPNIPLDYQTPAGYADAEAFINLFGATRNCGPYADPSSCLGTEGFTSDVADYPGGGQQVVVGLWADSVSGTAAYYDEGFPANYPQTSWLVRDAPASAVPEPISVVLLGSLCAITFSAHRLRKKAVKQE